MLGFYPHHIEYYREALMHRSMLAKNEKGKPLNNERLEFLGDAILDAMVGDVVFRHFQRKREGFLTNTRSKIVQRETLGKVAVEMGLDKLVQYTSRGQAHNSYMAGNAFEALIGAIYLDRGYDYCLHFLEKRILERYIDLDKMACTELNFKSKLLEWCQKNKVNIDFQLINEGKDETGAPVFSTKVRLNEQECGRGKGYSKKESHQKACKNALNNLSRNKRLMQQLTKKEDI
jgi:ribonuclease-3